MNRTDIFYKVLDFFGWIWFYFKKPFIGFGKLNWKVKLFIIILILAVFDWLRFLIFDILIWLITK